MTVESPNATAQRAPAPAKLRILATANGLFYEDGIRTVGIDRLISSSSVTKATFYKHYRSKDLLIVDYMNARHNDAINDFARTVEKADGPAAAIRALATATAEEIGRPGFRGCPFLNAAAEFSDPRHPVRQIVSDHRDWYTEQLGELARAAGLTAPGDAADELLLAKDGAMAGGYSGDPIAASAALMRATERVLSAAKG